MGNCSSFEDAWATKDKIWNLHRYNEIHSRRDFDTKRLLELPTVMLNHVYVCVCSVLLDSLQPRGL